ncbi:MAG: uroporphyrinogen decarboxylase family protein [Candidatus Poribacteria bacterium]
MTPRERVLRCLNHRTADRVPLSGSFRPEVWTKLREHFGTNDNNAITEKLGLDFKSVGMRASKEFLERSGGSGSIRHDDGSYENEWGIRHVIGENSPYMRYVYHPLSDESNLDRYKFPSLEGRFEGVKERVKQLQRNYVVSAGTATFFKDGWNLRGMEAFFIDIATESPFMVKLLDRLLEYKLEIVGQFAQAGVDIISIGGDIAMHTRLFMKPDLWRKHFKWRDAMLIEEARKYGVEHFFFHTDGNLMEVMEDLIEIGFDIIDPIQPECMNPYEIKERFGDRMTLHGTISSQRTLPFGTVEDVRNEVRERIERCGQNGGLVIAPNNVVQFDVPLENLLAVYETAKEGEIHQ